MESDFETSTRETGFPLAGQSTRDALAADVVEALDKGDHQRAAELLAEAVARFPDDVDLRRLAVKQQKQEARFARVQSLLKETRDSVEEHSFVQAMGAFCEAANLSQGFDSLEEAAFNTAIEQAKLLGIRNWRVAAALLNDAAQFKNKREIPAQLWAEIEGAEREENIGNLLAETAGARLGNLEQARERLTRTLERYPEDPALAARLRTVDWALGEQRQKEERRRRLKHLAAVADELAQLEDPALAKGFVARSEAVAESHAGEPDFKAMLDEIRDQVARSERAAEALAQDRIEDCLEECAIVLSRRRRHKLFLKWKERAEAREIELADQHVAEQKAAWRKTEGHITEGHIEVVRPIPRVKVEAEEPPVETHVRIEEPQPEKTGWAYWRLAAAAALLVIVSAVAFWSTRNERVPASKPATERPLASAPSAAAVEGEKLAPKPAKLAISGVVADTRVNVDGVFVGVAQPQVEWTHELTPGRHLVELSRGGYQAKSIERQLAPGEAMVLSGPAVELQSTDAIAMPSYAQVEQRDWQPTHKSEPQPLRASVAQSPSTTSVVPAPEQPEKALLAKNEGAEENDWATADKRSQAALQDYLTKYPRGGHATEAANALNEIERRNEAERAQAAEESAWRTVSQQDPGSLESYLRQYPAGKYRGQAEFDLANIRLAQSAKEDAAEIVGVIDRFAHAWSNKDIDSILAMARNLDRREVKAELAQSKAIVMNISPESPPRVSGARAIVVCRRQAVQIFSDGTKRKNPEGLVSYELAKRNGTWTIEGTR